MQLAPEVAAERGTFVTVETDDGQVWVGTLAPQPDGTFRVLSGFAGRPAIVAPEDITEVLPVNRSNPHIERS